MNKKYPKRLRKSVRGRLNESCGQINEDDCIDPREYFKPSNRGGKVDRKTMQLCRQVEQVLGLVMTSEAENSQLGNLQVLSVIPAPDASRLLVTLQSDCESRESHEQALQELAKEQPRLRWEVAASISRRRTPNLTFNVLPILRETDDGDEG